MAEEENDVLVSDRVLPSKRKLPDLEFPDGLKYYNGYNGNLVFEKNLVRKLSS